MAKRSKKPITPRRPTEGDDVTRAADQIETADGNQGQWSQDSASGFKPEDGDAQVSPEDKAIVQEVIDNVAFVKSYESTQRQAEEEEELFEGEDMWDTESRDARDEHQDDDGNEIPARPALSIPLHEQHIQIIVNEARQARLALTVKPKTGFAQTKVGDYIKGTMQTIQNESGALSIRVHALERTAKVGRAYYKIDAEYANDGDFDIDLRLRRILDQKSVYLDPYRQRADNEDMGWGILSDKISEQERRRRWPHKKLIVPEGAWTEDNDWFTSEKENPQSKMCRIATYYKVEVETRWLGYHPMWGQGFVKDMPGDIAGAVMHEAEGTRRREVPLKKIIVYTVDGTQVLEKREWRGRYIPIMECIGKEYYLRHRRRFKGVIASTMDILRAINVVLSSAIEVAGAMPRSPYIMFEGQDEGHETMWDRAGVANYTRLYIKREEMGGKPAPHPQRQMLEPQVQGLLLLLRVLQDFFHGVTGGVAPQLRAVNPYDRSGKAIEALQAQGAAGTSNYLDNLATITMPYEGRVLLSAIAGYYDRPGRIVRAASDDAEKDTAIMLKTPFTRDHNGMPVPVPCPACQGLGVLPANPQEFIPKPRQCPECKGTKEATKENMPEIWPPGEQGQTVEYVDFTEGEFSVVPAIDRNYQAKQEEALQGMSDLAKAAPDLVPAYAATWVRAMGFSGANKVADAIEAAFPTPGKDLGDERIPPRALAEITKLRQEHDAAMQALTEAQKIIETDQVKALASKDLEILRQAFAGKLEGLKAQAKMVEKSAEVQAKGALAAMQGQIDLMMQESEHRHEVVIQLLKERSEKELERHQAGIHEEAEQVAHQRLLEQGAVEHKRTLAEGEADARHESEQTDQKGQIDKEKADQAAGHKTAEQRRQAQIDADAQARQAKIDHEQSEQGHKQTIEQTVVAAKVAPKPAAKKGKSK